MTTRLTKYSQTQNLEAVKNLQQNNLYDIKTGDTQSPYSFSQWIQRNIGVIPGKERKQYNDYLIRWYEQKGISNQEIVNNLKNDYIIAVRQIGNTFKNDVSDIWKDDVNFDDLWDVEQAVPFYVKKLKEIAIYLVNKREAIKKAKLKYNHTGAQEAIKRLFYEYLLKAFTKKKFPGNEYITNVTDLSVLNQLPELSAAAQTFQITIEELYDDTMYFDRDPSLSASQYFDLQSTSVTSYLNNTFDLSGIETIEWLYKTGVSPLCADNPLLWVVDGILDQYDNGVPLSAVESFENQLLNDYNRIALAKKYIGENQYILSGGYYVVWTQDIAFNFVSGNNWFYWLSGETQFANDTLQTLDPISLTATTLAASAFAGSSYKTSDRIFVNRNGVVSGAWLRSIETISAVPTMSAKLIPGEFEFMFPYPGYGVSGEYLEWSGKTYDNIDFSFYYLEPEIQKIIKDIYWSTNTPAESAITSISIHDTELVDNNATAGVNFREADNITVREAGVGDAVPDQVFTGTQKYAWLYKFLKTDIPIVNGQNSIYWPLVRYEDTISTIAPSSQCTNVVLSAVQSTNLLGAVAGPTFHSSDVIYKLDSSKGNQIEAAWLSGKPISYTGVVSGVYQNALAFDTPAGFDTTFLWNNTNALADNVFRFFRHQTDCEYLKQQQFSLYRERPEQGRLPDYNIWQKCNCKAVYYTPFGHPGSVFDDYDRMADYLVLLPTASAIFDFTTWVGLDGKDYTQSEDFGWFRATDVVEPDAGWGVGNWIDGNGNPFTLKQNQLYVHYRSNLKRTNASDAPYYVIKYAYNLNAPQWIKAVKNGENEWVSTDAPSDMVLTPGDYLTYDHMTTYGFLVTSLSAAPSVTYNATAANFAYNADGKSFWSNYTYVTTGIQISINWPTTMSIVGPSTYLGSTNLNSIDWTVRGPSTFGTQRALSSTAGISINFATSISGVYFVEASGYAFHGDERHLTEIFTRIPAITCIPPIPEYSYPVIYDNFTINSTNFVMNIPLSGWDYNTGRYVGGSVLGARPFWAKASDASEESTDYKTIDIWGGNLTTQDSYDLVYQPEFSDIEFKQDEYIKYNRKGNSIIYWKQPFTITKSVCDKVWSVLDVVVGPSNLSAILFNNYNELITKESFETSPITFDIIQDQPLLVNYYANSGFTWNQTVSNTSLGLPPTGGLLISPVSGLLVEALTPYAYLSNRHYPTVATVPHIGLLYDTEESGGFFIPKNLGVSTFLSKHFTSQLDFGSTTPIFRTPDVFSKDSGLTETDIDSPYEVKYDDARWMKSTPIEGNKKGYIIQARDHQDFMPYQTKFETNKTSNIGLRRTTDKYDPWHKEGDNVWENPVDFPPDFRKQYPIEYWYNQFNLPNKMVYQWKTDVFGNEYFLLKDKIYASLYDEKIANGYIWIRDQKNNIQPISAVLDDTFRHLSVINPNVSADLYANGFRNFELWFDVLMLETQNYLVFARIDYDFEANNGTGKIFTITDETYIYDLSASNNGYYAGCWFFPEDKKVTVCTTVSSVSGFIYPTIHSLNLDTFIIDDIFINNKTNFITQTTAAQISSYEKPVFTFNSSTQTYNLAFMCYGSLYTSVMIETVYITQLGENLQYSSVVVLTPNY